MAMQDLAMQRNSKMMTPQNGPENSPKNWPDRQAQAEAYIAQNGFPDQHIEAWKYTSLAHLATRNFSASQDNKASQASPATAPPILSAGEAIEIVIKDGHLQPLPACPKGLSIKDITGTSDLAALYARLEAHHIITALNASRQNCALSIELAANITLTSPLYISIIDSASDQAIYPFISLSIGAGSRMHLAEMHKSEAGLTCPVLLAEIGAGAQFHHIKHQKDSPHSTHLSFSTFYLNENSHVNSFTLAQGAALSRLETATIFLGENAHLQSASIYLGTDKQHHDLTSYVAHEHPSCSSSQIIRGVLDHQAKGVFQGKIRVAPDAQKTDGQQMSRTLLLSREAESNAKPELEIFADDVACSHGATIGELDKNHLFYLKCRGIDEQTAKAMLINAFLHDMLDHIEYAVFADLLRTDLDAWGQMHLNMPIKVPVNGPAKEPVKGPAKGSLSGVDPC